MNLSDNSNLPLDALYRIDAQCTEFERKWKEDDSPPRIIDFATGEGIERSELIRELVTLDVYYRTRLGQKPDADTYHRQLPDDHQAVSDAFIAKVHVPERQQIKSTYRHAAKERQPVEQTFRLRCPHCSNRLVLVALNESEVTCDNCGSSFGLSQPIGNQPFPREIQALGRFQLLQKLGRGAFGEVYRAYDPHLDVDVAIKLPRSGYFASQEQQDRFLREARNSAQLSHPNIVRVLNVNHQGGLPFIVSQLIEGETLADKLVGGWLPFRWSAQRMLKVAGALDYAHSQGVIHRDLKPSNILIDEADEPYLADFGLARREEGEITMTQDGQILGTPAYMSPEQALGDSSMVDHRSDIYSLGAVFFEMLTGEIPFQGNRNSLLAQLLNDDPVLPSRINPAVPRDLEVICLKALSKEPAGRYSTANEFQDDLRCWIEDRPIKARPISVVERAQRWRRRNPTLANLWAAAGSLLICVALISVAAYFSTSRALRQEEKARLASDWELYINQVNLAYREYESGNAGKARQILSACPEHLRDWEWNCLYRLCHREERIFQAGNVKSVAVSNSGQLIAFENGDRVEVWRTDGSSPAGYLQDVDGPLSFSPDGRLLSGFKGGRPFVWNWLDGQAVFSVELFANDASFVPDGDRLVIAGNKVAQVYAIGDGTLESEFQFAGNVQSISAVSVSDDSRFLAVAARLWELDGKAMQSRIQVWNLETGDLVQTTHTLVGRVKSLDFDTGSNKLIAGCIDTQQTIPDIHIWNVKTGELDDSLLGDRGTWGEHRMRSFGPNMGGGPVFGIEAVAFQPDGRAFLTGGAESYLTVWDSFRPEPIEKIKGHGSSIIDMALDDKGHLLATASRDETVRLWDLRDGIARKLLSRATPDISGQRYVTGNRDGSTVVAAAEVIGESNGSSVAEIWNGGTGQYQSIIDRFDAHTIAVHHQKPFLAAADNDSFEIKVWNHLDKSPPRVLSGHSSEIEFIQFSSNGKLMGSLSPFDMLIVWDVDSWEPVFQVKDVAGPGGRFYPDFISRPFEFSPDGTKVAVGNRRLGVSVFDIGSSGKIKEFERSNKNKGRNDYIVCAAFHPTEEQIATASREGIIETWSLSASGDPLRRLEFDNRWPRRVVFNCEGKYLMAVDEGFVRVWDTDTWNVKCTLRGGFYSADFSPSGERVITAGVDYNVSVWDVASEREIVTLENHGHAAQLLGNGRLIAVGVDALVRFLDGSAVQN